MENLKLKLLSTNYFIDNEWLDKYIDLVYKNKDSKYIKRFSQRHHILLKSYFKIINQEIDNSSDNLVNLSYVDHILAHYYLCLCTKEKLKFGNAQAFQWLCDCSYKKSSEKIIKENFEYWQEIYNTQCKYKSLINTKTDCVSVEVFDIHGNYLYSEPSQRAVAKRLNVSPAAVNNAIIQKHSCTDKIICLVGDIDSKSEILNKITLNESASKIYLYDFNGNLINTYNKITDICEFNQKYIRSCVNGRVLTTLNYIWISYPETILERLDKLNNIKNYSNDRLVFVFNKLGALELLFDSVPQAAKYFNTYPNKIRACCEDKLHTVNDYILSYSQDLESDRLYKILNSKYTQDTISIDQYDMSGNYIRTFNSISEARETLKIFHINECLTGTRKSAGGYIWKKSLEGL